MKFISIAGLAVILACAVPIARAQQDSGPQTTDPDDITDTLLRSKAKGRLIACADPYDWPYSSQNADPPGFDIEIIRAIAKRGGMRLEMYWADTGTRGGLGRAFRNSILAKRCDVFVGLSDNGDDDLLPKKLVFSEPYLGLGYVLVVQGKADGVKSVAELKQAKLKVGVPMSTPIDDYMFTNQIPRELYLDNRRIMQGMAKGEVDVSVVWATAIAVAKNEFPDAKFHMVDGYVPIEGQRFNMKFAIRKDDQSLLDFVNEGIKDLLVSGRIQKIVESYGLPYYAPFSS